MENENILSPDALRDENASLILSLEERCKKAAIEIKEDEDPFEEDLKTLILQLPAGREKKPYYLFDSDGIKKLLSIPFENYVFLRPYEAICSYSEGTIEALVTSVDRMPFSLVRRRLLRKQKVEDDDEDEINIEIQSPERDFKIYLGSLSQSLNILVGRMRRNRLSLKLTGINISRYDDAIKILTKLTDSFFYQIDLSFSVALNLVRERRRPALFRNLIKTNATIEDIQFPRNEYDEAPMSLYWYARSAQGMPLLQFFAYYQVIEFYLPIYYQAEARRKIKRVIKSPLFRTDRDADVGKILAVLTSRGHSVGDERSMMRATLQECLDTDDLREFLTADEERKVFFSSKSKGLTAHKLPLMNPSIDLRNDVADRIYNIRCKIVHTKSDAHEGEVELLLPFSKEAEQLYFDIHLIQYIARRVLITASSPLKI